MNANGTQELLIGNTSTVIINGVEKELDDNEYINYLRQRRQWGKLYEYAEANNE